MKQIILIFPFLLLFSFSVQAQTTFASVELSRNAVYPGEPFQLTVKTYTSTYFLSPITFEDFRIPSAFTISFSRTVSSGARIDGKQYASIQFYMQVYPLESGQLEIPPIKLSFQSPPEGVYKGKLQQIETNPATITIKPIPGNIEVNPWFVANEISLIDNWNKSIKIYMVGDIIERQVLVKAFGTLPYFIPELNFGENAGVEIYPKTEELIDKRNDEQAIGWKTQKVLYLLTKEGDVEIPGIEVDWFNPLTSRLTSSKIAPKTIQVLPNPNLGILESIRDSLNVAPTELEKDIVASDKPNYRRIGLLAALFVIVLFLIWNGYKLLIVAIERLKERQKIYRTSSEWHYKQILRNSNTPAEAINGINIWWDIARKDHYPASISDALKGNSALEIWLKLQKLNTKPNIKELKLLISELRSLTKTTNKQVDIFSINPKQYQL